MQVLVALNANMAGDRTRQPSTNEQIFDWLTHEHRTLLLSMLTCSPTRTAVIELLRLRVCQDTDRIVGSYMSAIAQTTSSDLLPPLLLLLLFPPLLLVLLPSSLLLPFFSSSAPGCCDWTTFDDVDNYQTLFASTETPNECFCGA